MQLIRMLSDGRGMVIDLPIDEITWAAEQAGVKITTKQAEAWLANNHNFIANGIRQLIKINLSRNNKKFL